MATAIGLAHQVDWDVPEQTGLWKDAWVRFRRNRLAVAGLVVIVVMIVLALGARLPATPGGLWKILHLTNEPFLQDVTNSYATPSLQHPLGTDILGRDQLSRILYGASISLTIGTATWSATAVGPSPNCPRHCWRPCAATWISDSVFASTPNASPSAASARSANPRRDDRAHSVLPV